MNVSDGEKKLRIFSAWMQIVEQYLPAVIRGRDGVKRPASVSPKRGRPTRWWERSAHRSAASLTPLSAFARLLTETAVECAVVSIVGDIALTMPRPSKATVSTAKPQTTERNNGRQTLIRGNAGRDPLVASASANSLALLSQLQCSSRAALSVSPSTISNARKAASY